MELFPERSFCNILFIYGRVAHDINLNPTAFPKRGNDAQIAELLQNLADFRFDVLIIRINGAEFIYQ